MPGIAIGKIEILENPSHYDIRLMSEDQILQFAFDEKNWGKLIIHHELNSIDYDVIIFNVEVLVDIILYNTKKFNVIYFIKICFKI